MTVEEISKGWLCVAKLQDKVSEPVVLNRRFPVVQGHQVRAIDDFTKSGVNLSFQAVERITLHDADVVSTFVKVVEDVCAGVIKTLTFSDGSRKPIQLHRAWRQEPQLTGTTLDMASAYKQLPAHPSQNHLAAGAVYNTESRQPLLFFQRTLPFGGSASVAAFNRCSRSLWTIGIKKWGLP